MAGRAPLWRRAFDAVEKPLGDTLASGARSGAFADVLAVALRVNRRLQREVERRTRRALHLVNLPAGTDVRLMREQLHRMERRLEQLTDDVEDLDPRRRAPAAD